MLAYMKETQRLVPFPLSDTLHRFAAVLSTGEIPRASFSRLCGDRHILCGCLPHRLHGRHRGGVSHEEHREEAGLWGPPGGPQTEQTDPPAPPGNRK